MDVIRSAGGGILNEGRLELRRVVVQGNGGLLVSGLGIWNGGTLVLRRSTVRGNWEQDGGDGAITNHGTLLLRRSWVLRNDQAGIVNHGTARVVESVVTGHRLDDLAQGITNHGEMTILRSSIRGNVAGGLTGSGIGNSGTLTVIDSVIRDNRGESGIFNTGTLTIIGSLIRHNRADVYGGGIGNSGTLAPLHIRLTNRPRARPSWPARPRDCGGRSSGWARNAITGQIARRRRQWARRFSVITARRGPRATDDDKVDTAGRDHRAQYPALGPPRGWGASGIPSARPGPG